MVTVSLQNLGAFSTASETEINQSASAPECQQNITVLGPVSSDQKIDDRDISKRLRLA